MLLRSFRAVVLLQNIDSSLRNYSREQVVVYFYLLRKAYKICLILDLAMFDSGAPL